MSYSLQITPENMKATLHASCTEIKVYCNTVYFKI